MSVEDRFEEAFRKLKREFKHKTRRRFLDDVRAEIEDDEVFVEFLERPSPRADQAPRYVAVTFDRRKNDGKFSYAYFDLLLVALDALAGGHGIYKPANQFRAIRWNAKRSDLLKLLRHFGRIDHRVRFGRALVLPFPVPAIGVRIDRKVHAK